MLGRGLESLIPNKSEKQETRDQRPEIKAEILSADYGRLRNDKNNIETGEAIFQIEVDKIKVNSQQPRKVFDQTALQELASSIREHGIIQPLIVSKKVQETDRGTAVEYELIAGERRLQASRLLGLQRVPAIVRSAPQEKEKLELALIENIQRENLSIMELARAYSRLGDNFGMTQREIGVRVGKSRETVANTLRLLNLPTHIQLAMSENKISESQARLLLGVADQKRQEELYNDLCQNNLSVRELKGRVTRLRAEKSSMAKFVLTTESASSPRIVDPELIAIQDILEEALEIKVKLEKDSQTGNLSITFSSAGDLQILVNKLLDEN